MKLLLCLCLAVLIGCGKKPAASNESTAATAPTAPSAKPSEPSASAPAEIDYSKSLDRLTQAVRRYAAETRNAPKSLNELVAAGYLPELPVAPAGKRYVIDDQLRVQLK